MFPQIFRLAMRDPQALADHLEAYAELFGDELRIVAAQWQHRTAMHLLAYACFAVAVTLLGVALLLWAALPSLSLSTLSLMALAPLSPALLGLWIATRIDATVETMPFAVLRSQWAADRVVLNEAARHE